MRRAGRLFGFVLLVGATASATLAIAQPRGGKAPARPKPAASTKVEAGAPAVDAEPTSEAPLEPSPVASEILDGGTRPSPLNPRPEELPSRTSDAGAPVDYDRLLADIQGLRARVASLGDGLYRSRIAVSLETSGDHGKVSRLTVSIDDGVVWTAPAAFAPSDPAIVYDHAVAPGRHAVTVDVDRKDDRDDTFRSSQRSRFTVDVPREQRVTIEVKLTDDSTMGKNFPGDRSGRYDLGLRVKAVSKPVTK